MTKLQPAAVSNCDNVTLTPNIREHGEIKGIQLDPCHGPPSDQSAEMDPSGHDGNESNSESAGDYNEPLGYQNFLYDVHVEYSPGGNQSSPLGSKYSFKMKCLPYMITCNDRLSHYSSIDSSSSDITNSDKEETNRQSILDTQTIDLAGPTSTMQIDVTRERCAFLGNSDFVPNFKNKARKVILELVSAKLSQSSGYRMPPDASISNLTTLTENQLPVSANSDTSSLSSYNSHSFTNHQESKIQTDANYKLVPPPSPSSSKKFVNYTILIKTTPGLDAHPAVIERRFSDFLNLHQGLMSEKAYASIIEKYVIFPKKVYMGNFSLEKIVERSIGFTRLLNVCMNNENLTRSVPFMSFLVDRELKEAHRLSLFGDPDDVQALIENAYYVEQKLYFTQEPQPGSVSSSCSLDLSNCHTSTLPDARSQATPNHSRNNQTISSEEMNSSNNIAPDARRAHDDVNLSDASLRSSSSMCESHNGGSLSSFEKDSLSPINQRILVTFCMLFVTYCRSQNHQGLRHAVGEFGQLISSHVYIDSLINTRHYNSLRACLVFLMNLNRADIVDDNIRMLLKRKLEDIDGIQTELDANIGASISNSRNLSSSLRIRRSSLRDGDANGMSPVKETSRLTKNDLTSLLRDRHFCSFDGRKFS